MYRYHEFSDTCSVRTNVKFVLAFFEDVCDRTLLFVIFNRYLRGKDYLSRSLHILVVQTYLLGILLVYFSNSLSRRVFLFNNFLIKEKIVRIVGGSGLIVLALVEISLKRVDGVLAEVIGL